MKKVHFIGICGAGMSATAKLLRECGWNVTGSDKDFYPPVSTYLEENKIPLTVGYRQENIPADADLIVIGRHAKLVPENNEEVRAALTAGKPVKSFAEVLGELSKDHKVILTAGSYGKSTCAALLSWCLEQSGINPSYMIGAIPSTPECSSKKGGGEWFLLEGDEYPSAHWDNRAKFLHYHAQHLLLTSFSHDHLNVYPTKEAYIHPFKELIGSLPSTGMIVACADGEGVKEVLAQCGRSAIFYSCQSQAQWRADRIEFGETSCFDLIANGRTIVRLTTSLLGLHNIENVVGSSALLLSLSLVTPRQLQEAVLTFKPLTRRLDKKSDRTSIPIYEGFGSSSVKAQAAIRAIKLHFPTRKLIVLFEPHALSWQERSALKWYDKTFIGADSLLLYKEPRLDDNNSEPLKLEEMVQRVRQNGIKSAGFEKLSAVIDILQKSVGPDSVVLCLSSGGFDGVIARIVSWLEEKFPKT